MILDENDLVKIILSMVVYAFKKIDAKQAVCSRS